MDIFDPKNKVIHDKKKIMIIFDQRKKLFMTINSV